MSLTRIGGRKLFETEFEGAGILVGARDPLARSRRDVRQLNFSSAMT